jgi:rubredoxin
MKKYGCPKCGCDKAEMSVTITATAFYTIKFGKENPLDFEEQEFGFQDGTDWTGEPSFTCADCGYEFDEPGEKIK